MCDGVHRGAGGASFAPPRSLFLKCRCVSPLQGADVTKAAYNGLNALHVACKNGHDAIVRLLISRHGKEVCNTRTTDGRTP